MEEGHVAAGASATAGKWTGARGDGCASCAGGQRPDEGAAGPPFLEPRSTLAASPAREGGRRGDEDAAEPATGLGEVELVAVQGGAQACAAATEWLDDVGVAKGDTEWLDDVGVPAQRREHISAAAADEDLGFAGVVGHDRGLHHAHGGAGGSGDDAEGRAHGSAESTPVVVNALLGDNVSFGTVSTNTNSEPIEPAEGAWFGKRWAARLCACNLLLAPLSLLAPGTCNDGDCSTTCINIVCSICA